MLYICIIIKLNQKIMKRIIPLAAFLPYLLFLSCGSGEESSKLEKKQAEVEIIEDSFLSPEDINSSIPVPVGEIKDIFRAWKGQTVIIRAYCDFFFDTGTIGQKVNLKSSPTDSKKLIECNMSEAHDEMLSSNDAFIFKGVIDSDFYGTIILTDCEIIPHGKYEDFSGKINPSNPSSKVIPVQKFYDAYYGWIGKEISVVGYYSSTTTSTTSYGTTVRIDLNDPETQQKVVVCEMIEAPDSALNLANNRDNLVIKGIIAGELFGNVKMEKCEIIE